MKLSFYGIVALAAGALPAVALGQVSQTYQYDANGRLTGVTTTGPSGTNTASYAYDDANNRTSRSQTGVAYASVLELPVIEALRPNQALVSVDGRYSLAMGPLGTLALLRGNAELRTAGAERMTAAFVVDTDGAARFRPPFHMSHAQLAAARLSLNEEGDLVLRDRSGGTVLWRASSNLSGEGPQ